MTQVGAPQSWGTAAYFKELLNKADKDHDGKISLNELNAAGTPNSSDKVAYNILKDKVLENRQDTFITQSNYLDFTRKNAFDSNYKSHSSSSTDSGSQNTSPVGATARDAGNPFQLISN